MNLHFLLKVNTRFLKFTIKIWFCFEHWKTSIKIFTTYPIKQTRTKIERQWFTGQRFFSWALDRADEQDYQIHRFFNKFWHCVTLLFTAKLKNKSVFRKYKRFIYFTFFSGMFNMMEANSFLSSTAAESVSVSTPNRRDVKKPLALRVSPIRGQNAIFRRSDFSNDSNLFSSRSLASTYRGFVYPRLKFPIDF